MAARLLLAVAADGKGALLREGGQQVQGAAGGGFGHFLAEFAHELLPELVCLGLLAVVLQPVRFERGVHGVGLGREFGVPDVVVVADRKSTRLNSSHLVISYAVFCLKKKKHGFVAELRITSCMSAWLCPALCRSS